MVDSRFQKSPLWPMLHCGLFNLVSITLYYLGFGPRVTRFGDPDPTPVEMSVPMPADVLKNMYDRYIYRSICTIEDR